MSKLRKSVIAAAVTAAAVVATPLAASAQYSRPTPEPAPSTPPGDWCLIEMAGGSTQGGSFWCD